MNSFQKVIIFTIALVVCVVTISVSIVSTIKSIRQLEYETNRISCNQKIESGTDKIEKEISTVIDDYLIVAEKKGIKTSKILVKDNKLAELDFKFSPDNAKDYFTSIMDLEMIKINSLSLNSVNGEIKGKISFSVAESKPGKGDLKNEKLDRLCSLFNSGLNKISHSAVVNPSKKNPNIVQITSAPDFDAVLIGEVGDAENKSFYLKLSGKDEIVSVTGKLSMEKGCRYIISSDKNGINRIRLLGPV